MRHAYFSNLPKEVFSLPNGMRFIFLFDKNNLINQPHTISVQDIIQLCVIHRSCVLKVGAVECPSTLQ